MDFYYFYILRSTKDNSHYYGQTSNLKERLKQHQAGKVSSTSYRLPLELVYYEAYRTQSQAVNRERSVKKSGSVRQSLNKRIGV